MGNIKQNNLQKVSEGASRELDWIRSEKLDRSRNCLASLLSSCPAASSSRISSFSSFDDDFDFSTKTLPLSFCSSLSRAFGKLRLTPPDSSRGDTNHLSPDESGREKRKRQNIGIVEGALLIFILPSAYCFFTMRLGPSWSRDVLFLTFHSAHTLSSLKAKFVKAKAEFVTKSWPTPTGSRKKSSRRALFLD